VEINFKKGCFRLGNSEKLSIFAAAQQGSIDAAMVGKVL